MKCGICEHSSHSKMSYVIYTNCQFNFLYFKEERLLEFKSGFYILHKSLMMMAKSVISWNYIIKFEIFPNINYLRYLSLAKCDFAS